LGEGGEQGFEIRAVALAEHVDVVLVEANPLPVASAIEVGKGVELQENQPLNRGAPHVELDGNRAEGALTLATDGHHAVQGTLASDSLEFTRYASGVSVRGTNSRSWDSLPIELDGLTAFQRAVLEALRGEADRVGSSIIMLTGAAYQAV